MGELGEGTTVDRDCPVRVQGVSDAIAVSAGGYFSAAVLADGTVVTWGRDWTVRDAPPAPVPRTLPGVRDVKAIATGHGHAVALTHAGTLISWGENAHYGPGRGRGAARMPPGTVRGLNGVRSIAAYDETSVAILASGRIMTWGETRPCSRPDGQPDLSPLPILLWVDGLDQDWVAS